MQQLSIIYRNLLIYRLVMNLLYTGGYRQRFKKIEDVLDKIQPQNVLELCFGDTYIATYCKRNGIQWQGIDINDSFVAAAVRKGYIARQADLLSLKKLPQSDLCIISGSLYHFNQNIHQFLQLILSSTSNIII